MLNKILTNIVIFMLIVLPVQVINAGIESHSLKQPAVQVSVEKIIQSQHECMHSKAGENISMDKKPCCEENLSKHTCEGCDTCGDCDQASSASYIFSTYSVMQVNLNKQKILSKHLAINGIPQKNPVKPPLSFFNY